MPAMRAIPSMMRVLALLAAAVFPPPVSAGPGPPDDLAHAVAQLEQRLQRDPRRVAAPDLEAYLHGVICRLDADRCGGMRTLVLREPGFNASIAPGGLIVLRTGALLRCHDEAELALVLAHELAHDQRGDARERWRRAGAGLVDHRDTHSRKAEAEADADAIAMLAAAGYDVAAGERLWTRLVAEEADGPSKRTKKSRNSHPPAAERLEAFRIAAARLHAQGNADRARDSGRDRWSRQIAPYRRAWLGEEIARGRPAVTVAMFEAAIESTADPAADDLFALGQALRRRDAPGDRPRATSLYARAAGRPDAPAAAFRELGLARLSGGDAAGGREALAHYLTLEPEPADAGFVAALLDDGARLTRETDGQPATTRAGPATREIRVFDLRLRTDLRWTRHPGIGLEQWTLGGVDNDRLLVVPNLRPGEPLFRDAGRTDPRHRPGLRPDEQRDQVVAALHAAGWLEVHADGPRRHDFGGEAGWHSNLALADAAGVRYRGSFVFVERGERLTLLLWFATAEQAFPRDAAAIEAMLASAGFAD